jgi:hypothetical protein
MKMVKNNRTNEEDLREGLKEKAQMAKNKTANMKLREQEKEEDKRKNEKPRS